MKERLKTHIDNVLAQVEDLEPEDRWAILEEAIRLSTMTKFVIERDTDAENPRTLFDHIGTMYCWHPRYNLGDKNPIKSGYSDPTEWYAAEVSEEDVVLPLYLMDHSGITMKTSPFPCRWDSGQVGWIVCTAADLAKNFSGLADVEDAKECLEQEVKEYDLFLCGEVWMCHENDEYCGGFYGDTLEDTGIESHYGLPKEVIEAAWEART